MSRVAFLLGSFYPDFSAVGYCAYRVLKCMAGDFDITVVAFRNRASHSLEEAHEGIDIQRIETDDMKRRNALAADAGAFARARRDALRAWGAARRLLAPETIDQSLVRAYLDRLDRMDPPPSAIVPLVFPFETVQAALAYKRAHPAVQVIPYLFDDFVDSGSLHVLRVARRLKRKRHLRLERRMLAEADAVLAMHPLRRHFEANFEAPLADKISFLEHPLLSPPADVERRPDDGVARLCFTGSLIPKVREPDYLLNLLRAIRPTMPVRADFFVMGNDAGKVRTGTFANGVEVVNHGRVPKSDADAAVRDADILLNIGEAQGRQVSSKVFEYMSAGKPIIHLAYVRDDAVSQILEKYPLALCLVRDRGSLAANANLVSDFIAGNRRSSVSFAELEAIYPEALPEVTAKILKAIMKISEL
jgi:glycosyltransferase involved in cell wall biosynthesis